MGKGRAPCCDKSKVKKGPWSSSEDLQLITFIQQHGHSNWRALPSQAGLLRCGKSCRLRWINYLRPDVKRGDFTPEEEQSIIKLHEEYGNKWSKIASELPGRTDNEIKNIWNTHLKKRLGIISSKRNTSKRMKIKKANPNDSVVEPSSVKSSSSLSCSDQVDRDSKGTGSHAEWEMPDLHICQPSPSNDGPKESSSPSLTSCNSNISIKDRNHVQMDASLDIPFEGMGIDDLGALEELGFETMFELEETSFWNNLEINNLYSIHTNETEDRPSKASEESSSFGFEEMHPVSSEVVTQNWIRNLEIELGLDDV